jgi:hypothetical protein
MNMKLCEIQTERDPKKLYTMALKVGQQQFGKSHSGFVHVPELKNVKKLTVAKAGSLDTFGWVFYPSDLKRFNDYSDTSFKKIPPDEDGFVYAADADGNLYIVSGSTAKTESTTYKAIFKGFAYKGWTVEHISESPKECTVYLLNTKLKRDYDDANVQLKIEGGRFNCFGSRQEQGGAQEWFTDIKNMNGTAFTLDKLKAYLDDATEKFSRPLPPKPTGTRHVLLK